MDNSDNLNTFLFIGPEKIEISVKKKDDLRIYYQNEVENKSFKKEEIYLLLDKFLNENIFKIEKKFNFFVENIILIIDDDNQLDIKVSFKKKNDIDKFNQKSLNYLLTEAKNQISESYKEKIIIHMIIDNYLLDDNLYKTIPDDITYSQFSVSISFICLRINYIRNLEKILGNYQIKIQQIISAQYLRDLFNNDTDFFSSGQKILDGYNQNEILFVPRTQKNRGFFEKFFLFFS